MILSLGMFFMMCAVSFLFITSSATGTRLLVNSALTSKETMVSSEMMHFACVSLQNPYKEF